jgi:hypothetical protein
VSPSGISSFRVRFHALRSEDSPRFRAAMLRAALNALTSEDRDELVHALKLTTADESPIPWTQAGMSAELRVLLKIGTPLSDRPIDAERARERFVKRCSFLLEDERTVLATAMGSGT